jgi:predicted RecA/RadA family phage recombinase
MTNYTQPGHTLTLAAPYDVASGAGFLVGSIFAVAAFAALSGADVEGKITGVYELAKTSAQAWTVGALIYWDNTAKACTTVSTSNKLIGVATAVAANPSATGFVRLNGAFIS